VFPLSRKKRHFRHLFWIPADKNFKNRHLHFLDTNSFIGENFTKLNLNIFSKMYGTYFHDWSCFQVTAYIKSSDVFWEFSDCKVYKEVLGAFSWFLRLPTKLFAMKFRYIFWVIRLQSLQKCFGHIFTIFACKNEAACREVQAHFGGFHFAS